MFRTEPLPNAVTAGGISGTPYPAGIAVGDNEHGQTPFSTADRLACPESIVLYFPDVGATALMLLLFVVFKVSLVLGVRLQDVGRVNPLDLIAVENGNLINKIKEFTPMF